MRADETDGAPNMTCCMFLFILHACFILALNVARAEKKKSNQIKQQKRDSGKIHTRYCDISTGGCHFLWLPQAKANPHKGSLSRINETIVSKTKSQVLRNFETNGE